MADLPIELWHSIFDRLELTDLFSCALVSKKFNLLVKEYRIKELAFIGRAHQWFHYDFSIYQHRVDYSWSSILKRSSFNFDCLKRLKIGQCSTIDDLNLINKFSRLEELDIDLKNYRNEKSRSLSLANLRVLFVFVPSCMPFLELDTPKLAKVRTFSLKKLDFIYPESVRCIRTFCHRGTLSMFRNLEYLAFTDFYSEPDYIPKYGTFEVFSLTALKKLKEIDFLYYYCCDSFEIWNWSILKKFIQHILDLKRPDLKVFWKSIQSSDTELLTVYKENRKSNTSIIAFQLNHYDQLKEEIDSFPCYNFSGSMRLLPKAGIDPGSEDFFSKLVSKYSFREIDVTERVEQKERKVLMELIARSPNLMSLDFSNSGLDQEFFDRIAETIQSNRISLRSFCFADSSNNSLSYDFILKLPSLERFVTDQNLPPELITKLVGLPFLVEITCYFGKDQIDRVSTNKFYLKRKPVSLSELLEHLNPKPKPELVDELTSQQIAQRTIWCSLM